MKDQERKELASKLQGVMEFYVSTYFEYYGEEVKKEIAKSNAFIEVGIMERQINDYIKGMIDEATDKFHSIAMLILDTIVSGKEHKVREFELLFIDLVKRTLLKDIKEAQVRPIVIIADSNVGAKEN
jgi:hypothetical protein